MFLILTALSMTISTILLAIAGVLGEAEGQEVLHQKMRGFRKNG